MPQLFQNMISHFFYFSNFRGTLETDDVIGMTASFYVNLGLLMQSMFSLQMLIVMKTVMARPSVKRYIEQV